MAAAARFADQLKLSNTTNVTIYVGKRTKENDPYVLPRAILATASPHFSSILNSDLKEGQSGILEFDDSHEFWTLFIYWLFHRNIPEPDKSTGLSAGPRALSPFFASLVNAWVAGEKYDIPAFQNAVMTRFIKTLEISFPPLTTVFDVFQLTPTGCPLQKLVVQELVVAVQRHRILTWADIESEHFNALDGFFTLFMQCTQDFYDHPKAYPMHGYGRCQGEMDTYMVEEDRDLENEVASMMREHGQE